MVRLTAWPKKPPIAVVLGTESMRKILLRYAVSERKPNYIHFK